MPLLSTRKGVCMHKKAKLDKIMADRTPRALNTERWNPAKLACFVRSLRSWTLDSRPGWHFWHSRASYLESLWVYCKNSENMRVHNER